MFAALQHRLAYTKRMGDIARAALRVHDRKCAELKGNSLTNYLLANRDAIRQASCNIEFPWIDFYLHVVSGNADLES